ncbi:DEAD-box family helicase [Theileria orientalis]|uniref:DEAD-box family helicase n=1 Tax=Theileria orientalis TaxID=68886 RepID=A0A976MAU4_THEOR|nr:DEAD-box family helicase [Theileria orientalis]
MSSRDVNTEDKSDEKDRKEEHKMKPETQHIKYFSMKEDLGKVTVPKKKAVGRPKSGVAMEEVRMKSELNYGGMEKEGIEGNRSKENQESLETREESAEKNKQSCASDGSAEGESTETEERRSRRTAAINQRLLMKKIASQEPVMEVAEDSPEVKRRKRNERRRINVITDINEYEDGIYEPSRVYEEDPPYEPKVTYEHSRKYESEEYVPEYVSDEKVEQEVLDNPGEIYNFNEHEVKRKIKKVLVNKEHIFKKGLKYVEEYMMKNMSMFQNNNEQLRRMGLENVKIETEYFYKFGGSYEDMGDQVDEVNKKIESLQGELNELHSKMGKSQLVKQNEPSVLYAYVSQTLNIKDKTLEYEEILQEMKDFQDLVNDEHREKRRLFKNLIMGTSKQMLKVEQEYQKNDAERMKQVQQLYKNVSNMIDLFWKKIEKFAWEHLKKDLQQELIKKKKQNLDKFIQDAIKVSINDQERYIFDKKIKRTGGESNRINMESSEEEGEEDEDGKGVVKDVKDSSTGEESKVNGVGRMSRKKTNLEKKGITKTSTNTKTTEDEEDLVEEEYVFDKDEEKMEMDDLKLEDEMDSDKEENELDDLQKDLEMPLEELLKMYKQQSNGDIDEEYEEEFSDYTDDQTPDDNDEVHHDDQEVAVYGGKSLNSRAHNRSMTTGAKSTEKEVQVPVKDDKSRRESTNTADGSQSSSSNKVGRDKKDVPASSTKPTEDEDDLVEEEYVFDKDEEKMEMDDLKLEDEMDSDKEENELDDLQKDLEMPLEELLKMYKQQSNGDIDEEYEEEFSDYTDDQTPDDNDEVHHDDQEVAVYGGKSLNSRAHNRSMTTGAKSTEKEVQVPVKDDKSRRESTNTADGSQSSSSNKVGRDKKDVPASSTKPTEDEDDLVEEEYVFDKDEEKMEMDDLKLEDEMDSDKEENELDDLQKDLEMPLEELLKMYKQQSNGDIDDEQFEEDDVNESQQSYDGDEDYEESAVDVDKEKMVEGEDNYGLSEVSDGDLSDMSLETSENEEARKISMREGKGKKTAVSGGSTSHIPSRKAAKTTEKTSKTRTKEKGTSGVTSFRDIPLPQKRARETASKSPVRSGTRTAQTGLQSDSFSASGSTRPSAATRDSTAAIPKRDGTLAKDRTSSTLAKDRTSSKENKKEDGEEGSGEVKVPFLIKAVLRPYQKEGLGWLVSLYERGINGILADEMGLGKTLQTISLLAYLACYKENWGPHIIIVPTSILLNWVMEFNRFCPGFKVLAYYGTPAERSRKRSGWNRPHSFNVLVSSYTIVVQDAYVLKRRAWEYMILDEAQNIKNFHSKRWQTLLTFNTKYRLLLTGTPLQNSLQELWSLMHFILPNIFTSHTQFNIWFTDPLNQALDNLYSSNPLYKNESDLDNKEKEEMNRNNMELVEKLHVIFRPYLLRRLKKDVEKQMPSKYEHVLKCTLTKRQQVLYDEFINLYSLNTKGLDKERLSYRSMLNILMQLRKICNHPDQLKSRDVQIPIEFNIEPLTLPSMFKVIETGSIYNRRNGDETLVTDMKLLNGNGVDSLNLQNNHDQGRENVGSEMSGRRRTYYRSQNDMEKQKTENSPKNTTRMNTRNSLSPVSGATRKIPSPVQVSTRNSLSPVPGPTRNSIRIIRFDSPYAVHTSDGIKVESSPEPKSRSSGSDGVTRVMNTPTKRGSRSGESSSGSGGPDEAGVSCSSGNISSNNMVSPINSSQDSMYTGDEVVEDSPRTARDTSPRHRGYTITGVENGATGGVTFSSNTVKGLDKVDGLCMESYKRRRDKLILEKKVNRRRLDLNLNAECLIQYSAVSDPGVLDFGADLTNCGYGFSYGKVHTNDLLITHPAMARLTRTLLNNYNANNKSNNAGYNKNRNANANSNANANANGNFNPNSNLDANRMYINGTTNNGTSHASEAGNGPKVDTRVCINGSNKTNLTSPNAEDVLESVFNFNLKNDLEMNKVIEAYAPLVENFLVIPTKVVSRPIKLYYSGETGVNHNIRNDWLIKEVTTKVFERDDKEYYAKNKVTLEAINSQYRLLFPSKRALNDDCGKFRVLGPLLLKLKSEGHRCIIYTQFSKMLDILENWINFMGFTYTRLDGSTKIDMRQKIVNRFNENTKIFLFISSTRSGGVGITLTGADTVIFYDTDWNPAIDRQAMDRCHRIGQTKDVNVYRLISEHTVEENIWRKQLQKRKLDDLIVDQGQFDIQHNAWFSNIDTLINIFQSKKDDEEEEDIYGKTILHESNVGETNLKGTGVKSLKMLIEVEDADDSMALQKLTKENEKINKEDFENDMINTIPGLVTYCIKFLLKYQTAALEKQVELMKVKIQVEDYQNKQEDEEGDDDDIYTDYDSEDEAGEGSNEEEVEDQEEEDGELY